MKPLLQWVVTVGLFLAFPIWSRAQNWILTSAPMEEWLSMSSSASGSNLIAAAVGGLVYLSHDSGATWGLAGLPTGSWANTALSADGTKLVVAASEGGICTSDDSGVTWRSNNVPNEAWGAVAASADATKLYAAAFSEYQDNTDPPAGIFASTNSGGTWVLTAAPLRNWGSIACSADGTKVIAADEALRALSYPNPSCIWVSSNSGATFRLACSMDVGWWKSVACSSDGNTVIAAHSTGSLLSSNDGGGSWQTNAFSGTASGAGQSVACSADGRRMALSWVFQDAWTILWGPIYVSTDSGASWIETPLPAIGSQSVFWNCFCVSADGCRLAGAPVPDGFFSTGGIFTLQTTPSPALTVAHSGGILTLTWVVPSATFALQQSSDIGAASWTNVAAAPVLNYSTLREEVTAPSSGQQMFYGLVSRP
jgi:hypothetical protein